MKQHMGYIETKKRRVGLQLDNTLTSQSDHYSVEVRSRVSGIDSSPVRIYAQTPSGMVFFFSFHPRPPPPPGN
jgi:hypothetical protein